MALLEVKWKSCELVNISLNKNCVLEINQLSPTGIRIGTPCMTTRGMDNGGWIKLAHWLKRCVNICVERQNRLGKKLRDWGKNIEEDIAIKQLREEIINYCKELNFYEN